MRSALVAQGKHGLGSRFSKWTTAQVQAVIDELSSHLGKRNPITATQLEATLGVNVDRGERNLVSELDGIRLLLGGWNNGYYVAEWAEEAEEGDRRMRSQIASMQDRLDRRLAYRADHPLPYKIAPFCLSDSSWRYIYIAGIFWAVRAGLRGRRSEDRIGQATHHQEAIGRDPRALARAGRPGEGHRRVPRRNGRDVSPRVPELAARTGDDLDVA